jgi:uncharacterized membrane protein
MNINLLPFTVVWMILAAGVIGLILYRAWTARREDDRLHVDQSEIGLVSQQTATAEKLDSIDHWGEALTVIALLYGLTVGAGYIYQNWSVASNGFLK